MTRLFPGAQCNAIGKAFANARIADQLARAASEPSAKSGAGRIASRGSSAVLGALRLQRDAGCRLNPAQ
jgi:hypothetical protein